MSIVAILVIFLNCGIFNILVIVCYYDMMRDVIEWMARGRKGEREKKNDGYD